MYTSCENLPIYNFHKIMETNNYAYMLRGWNMEDDVKYNLEKAKENWQKIYSEYIDLTQNNSVSMYFNKVKELIDLEVKIFVCSNAILQVTLKKVNKTTGLKYIEVLRSFGIPYKGNEIKVQELENCSLFIKQLKNKIAKLNYELSELSKGESIRFEKEIVLVEQALGRDLIDPKTTTVIKWHYMMSYIKEVNEIKRKAIKNVR